MRMERRWPPYMGNEPFLAYCFSEGDAREASLLLERLYLRGCRVWYSVGTTADPAIRAQRQERISHALLVVLLLTENLRQDTGVKSTVLYAQAHGIPMICLDTDQGDNGLSIGLTSGIHLDFRGDLSGKEMEAQLIRTEGFSQELIGEPETEKAGWQRKLAITLTAAAVLVLLTGFAGHRYFGWFAPPIPEAPPIPTQTPTASPRPTMTPTATPTSTPTPAPTPILDEAVFSDAKFREIIREAIGGGPITKDALLDLFWIRTEYLPENLEEALGLLPSLSRLEIPQSLAEQVKPLLGLVDFDVVLIPKGGEEP